MPDNYPIQPGEAIRILVTESVDDHGESSLDVSIMGKPVPAYYAVGLLTQAVKSILDSSEESSAKWLEADNFGAD